MYFRTESQDGKCRSRSMRKGRLMVMVGEETQIDVSCYCGGRDEALYLFESTSQEGMITLS
jgi:hypothetical protein